MPGTTTTSTNDSTKQKPVRRSTRTGNLDDFEEPEAAQSAGIAGQPDTSANKQVNVSNEQLDKKLDKVLHDLANGMHSIRQDVGAFKSKVSEQLKNIETNFSLDMENVKQRLVNLESTMETVNDYVNMCEYGNFMVSRTLVLEGVRLNTGDSAENLAESFIHDGLELSHVRVFAVKCLGRRNQEPGTNPSILKIELKDEKTKVEALRSRSKLAGKAKFRNIRMRASQTHEERVMAQNSKLLLSLIPGGENYIVTGNSRIVSKDELARRNPRGPDGGQRNNDDGEFRLFGSIPSSQERGGSHSQGRRGGARGGRNFQNNRSGGNMGEAARQNSEGGR